MKFNESYRSHLDIKTVEPVNPDRKRLAMIVAAMREKNQSRNNNKRTLESRSSDLFANSPLQWRC